jgi:RNA polymerase sigma-70 factor (ECF subfamily)
LDTHSPATDEHLARARAGEPSAFAALVRSHQRSVFSLALRMLGNREAADDLAQDVFLQLHLNLQTIESGAHVGFWLRRVVTHRAIDKLRQRPRFEIASLDDEPEIADVAAPGDPLLQRHMRALVAELPSAARAVVLLRYQEDLDPLEIARTLDMPVNTVKSHLKRSLSALRERLGTTSHVAFEEFSRVRGTEL